MEEAEIGVFGGSGLYSLISNGKEIKIGTPYGQPSDIFTIGEISGRKVAFLPRHGKYHQYPPHAIPYRANIWAMKTLNIKRIISPCVVGSLQLNVKLGDFVICDQFIDRTKGRKDTFYDGPHIYHISSADPYCPELRRIIIKTCKELKLNVHEKGTVVVVEGPRFSTRAESLWYKNFSWDVINMTQYPEVVLAREMEICYANISLVTDYDVWQPNPVSHEEMLRILAQNIENVKKLIIAVIPNVPLERQCSCSKALSETGF